MSIEKIVGKLLKFTQKKRRIFDGMRDTVVHQNGNGLHNIAKVNGWFQGGKYAQWLALR